jgi:hypothetical protein
MPAFCGVREVSPPVAQNPPLRREHHHMTDRSERELQRQRAAKNQSLFREVNERILDLASSASSAGFVCECMNVECDEQLSLTIEQYESIRSHSNRFFVLPGHQVPELEQVVDSTDRYLVVSKLGAGHAVAEGLDPRKRIAPKP